MEAPFAPTVTSLAAQRRVYLQRLERLQRLRLQHQGELNQRGIRLLDRAVFAAYCACRDIGAGPEALAALRKLTREETPLPGPDELFGAAS